MKINPQQMLVNSGKVSQYIKKVLIIFSLFFAVNTGTAQAQPPVKDPSSPETPILPTQIPGAQFYDILKDKNTGTKSTIGGDLNNSLKNKINKFE